MTVRNRRAVALAGQRSNAGIKLVQEVVAKSLCGTVALANAPGAEVTITLRREDDSRT